jgi:phosphoglucosamine mutase
VRGVAGRDVTAELALDLASAAARVIVLGGEFGGRRPRAVVGADSRISGDYLAAAVAAGLASSGVDVLLVGVLPTPGLAYLTATEDIDLGVMLSASHNPMADNGIKFFARGGFKLPDQVEDSIEALVGKPWDRPTGEGVGRVRTDHLAVLAYADHLVATAPGKLEGLKVVLDCANGAASEVGPEAFRTLGAEVVVTAAAPNGLNINDGVGSTHPEALQAAVVAEGADLGFAFDGDADRCLAVDHAGALVSGDAIMGVLALALRARGALERDTLVTTVMSNIGLHKAMAERGIETVVTDVGDRYVLEAMLRGGFALGGEQSGHVIMTEFGTTGDGVLTAIQVASQVAVTGCRLRELAAAVPSFPQVLINVPGVDKARAAADPELRAAVERASARLGDTGRVLLRPSGTEPLVRVMVEAATHDTAQEVADGLAAAVRERAALAG